MFLGPISLLDCAVFVLFLVPSLFYHVGFLQTTWVLVRVLPFLVFKLPFRLVSERFFRKKQQRSPFVQNATFFEDLVVRCVRYAFANIPTNVARVFFSKGVAYPFFRFRLVRNGHLRMPIPCYELNRYGLNGLWVIPDALAKPDIVIYYCHGGGFSMGSSYFYLEFLMTWLSDLRDRGFQNPALLALDYTLVPDATWPKQFNETRAGYRFLTDHLHIEASKICVSGDSAGATLILSRLLHYGEIGQETQADESNRPGLAILISPWTHLISDHNQNTASDYLDRDSLHLYARQYSGEVAVDGDIISPGLSITGWQEASPRDGYRIIYGSEEVFTSGIDQMVRNMKRDGATVLVHKEVAGIHAWPVVNLFLGASRQERLKGIHRMSEFIMKSRMATEESNTAPNSSRTRFRSEEKSMAKE